MSDLKIGDPVMVPRTGGGETEGKVIAIYGEYGRVAFPIGDTFRGEPAPEEDRQRTGYKSLKLDRLRLINEAKV